MCISSFSTTLSFFSTTLCFSGTLMFPRDACVSFVLQRPSISPRPFLFLTVFFSFSKDPFFLKRTFLSQTTPVFLNDPFLSQRPLSFSKPPFFLNDPFLPQSPFVSRSPFVSGSPLCFSRPPCFLKNPSLSLFLTDPVSFSRTLSLKDPFSLSLSQRPFPFLEDSFSFSETLFLSQTPVSFLKDVFYLKHPLCLNDPLCLEDTNFLEDPALSQRQFASQGPFVSQRPFFPETLSLSHSETLSSQRPVLLEGPKDPFLHFSFSATFFLLKRISLSMSTTLFFLKEPFCLSKTPSLSQRPSLFRRPLSSKRGPPSSKDSFSERILVSKDLFVKEQFLKDAFFFDTLLSSCQILFLKIPLLNTTSQNHFLKPHLNAILHVHLSSP